jgi:hypothetical protein
MKKLTLIAAMAFACLLSKAQKIYRTEVDKFTGDTIVETKLETVYSKYGFSRGHKVTAAILKTKAYSI